MRHQLGIPKDALVVGSVTRLSPQKAPLDLVEAYGEIAKQYPNVWFVIVGDGQLRSEVEERLSSMGIKDKTILTGIRRDIPELMIAFDVFVLSSLWEGLPRVLPQAMATGLPIISTKVDGSSEVIKSGENGFLVPSGKPKELAEKVISLLEDESLRHQMGENSLLKASEFDAKKMVADIDILYQQLLQEKS